MKVIIKLIALNLIFVSMELLSEPTTMPTLTTSQQTKINKAKSAKSKAQAAKAQKAAVPTQRSAKVAPISEQESGDGKQLIEKFIQAVAEIKCSCGSSKKGEKVDSEKLCKHDKEHTEIVNKAFEIYKELHDATHGSGKSITEEDNKKVKPSVVKLFECKNIQKRAWHPKVTGQEKSASKATASK